MSKNKELVDLIKNGPREWIEEVRRGDIVTRMRVNRTSNGNTRVTVLSSYKIYG